MACFRLSIHPCAHPRPVAEGISFLGFIIFPNRSRLKRRKGIYFQRRLKRMVADYQAGKIPLSKITASVQGWANHARYANTVGLRKAVLGRLILKKGICTTREASVKESNKIKTGTVQHDDTQKSLAEGSL